MSSRAPSAWQVERALSVLLQARERLRSDPELAGDDQLLTDFLEADPETCDAYEMLHRLARAAIAAEDMGKMARARAAEIIARARRFDTQETWARDTLKAGMEAIGSQRLTAGDYTASIGKGKAPVVITSEDDLPEQFVKWTSAPMKREIGEALDKGETVEGAVRGNAPQTLRILRS